ncbi:MAG: hypothetical protein K2Q09_10690 [Phycisphaerales bacterium]|nr:hypothetical protein [Phycisphaerales bacterium]
MNPDQNPKMVPLPAVQHAKVRAGGGVPPGRLVGTTGEGGGGVGKGEGVVGIGNGPTGVGGAPAPGVGVVRGGADPGWAISALIAAAFAVSTFAP